MSELFTGPALESAMSAATSGDTGASASADPSTAAAGASPADSGAPTTEAAAGAGQTATSVDSTETPKDATTQGPIPFAAHKTALDNARTKAAQEVEARYAWATQIPQEHRSTVGDFYGLMDRAPVQAAETLIRTIAADPRHAPALRSLFGKLLGTNRAASSPAPTAAPAPSSAALPEPDFEDGQGNTFYSAGAMKKAFDALRADLTASFAKEYGPIKQDFRTRAQREAAARAEAQATREAADWAEREYAEVQTYPHFTRYETEIAKAMEADESLTAERAYIRIVVPKLSQQERQAVAESLHDKVNAAGIQPHATTAVAKPPKDFKEAFERLPASTFG